jgi:hypothetical protein
VGQCEEMGGFGCGRTLRCEEEAKVKVLCSDGSTKHCCPWHSRKAGTEPTKWSKYRRAAEVVPMPGFVAMMELARHMEVPVAKG